MLKITKGQKVFYQTVSSPLGDFVIAANEDSLIYTGFVDSRESVNESHGLINQENMVLTQAKRELEDYFNGRLTVFTVPYSFESTPFREKVWTELTRIPYGETISYAELAGRINSPKACRAVGQANHFNPISIIVPCHRVIGKDGSLVGYGGGIEKKQWLLNFENKLHNVQKKG